MRKLKFVIILFCFVLISISYLTSQALAVKFAYDFETGDLSGWTIIEGDAWDFQPTFGDNPTARNRG